jgi:hypothetical protein
MISKIISRAACLAELTSNPKSFSNCPDLHGGVPGLPEVVAQKERLASLGQASVELAHANNPNSVGSQVTEFRALGGRAAGRFRR